MQQEVSSYVLTEPMLDNLLAAEIGLREFWSHPENARRIRAHNSMNEIIAAIDSTPQMKATLAAHHLTGREYILGTFSMLGAFLYQMTQRVDPKKVAGLPCPASLETQALVARRTKDIQKALRIPDPPANAPAPPAVPR